MDFKENIINENLYEIKNGNTKEKQRFPLNQILYCSSLNSFVQTKKFYEDEDKYKCRVIKQASSTEKEELISTSDLSYNFAIKVEKWSQDQVIDTFEMTVNIEDKLSLILEVYEQMD